MSESQIRLFDNADAVAMAAASEVVELLAKLSDEQQIVHFALTGGTVGILTLKMLSSVDGSGVDWSKIHIWWGDERFVAADSSDRNANQARDAWLANSSIPDENIHEFPAETSAVNLDAAARIFQKTLAELAPKFDLVLLGMGPDGHVASLFPGHEGKAYGAEVIAEADSPKPPAQRLSFSYEALNGADRIWFTVAGSDKAQAVREVIENVDCQLPAAKVLGRLETVWFVDASASSLLTS